MIEYREIVGDEEHGCAGIVHQRCQQIDDLPLRDRIQRGGWLVGDNQARRRDQCGRDADALLLASRHLARVMAGFNAAEGFWNTMPT